MIPEVDSLWVVDLALIGRMSVLLECIPFMDKLMTLIFLSTLLLVALR